MHPHRAQRAHTRDTFDGKRALLHSPSRRDVAAARHEQGAQPSSFCDLSGKQLPAAASVCTPLGRALTDAPGSTGLTRRCIIDGTHLTTPGDSADGTPTNAVDSDWAPSRN